MDGGDRSEPGPWGESCGKSNFVSDHHFALMLSPVIKFRTKTNTLHFQTCAHRYQRCLFVKTPQESCDITGRCYILSQDLTIDPSSDEDGGSWNFCEGRSRGHEMFGSCQQGLAATFTKDYHYVVFGAPGAYNWKGDELNVIYRIYWGN